MHFQKGNVNMSLIKICCWPVRKIDTTTYCRAFIVSYFNRRGEGAWAITLNWFLNILLLPLKCHIYTLFITIIKYIFKNKTYNANFIEKISMKKPKWVGRMPICIMNFSHLTGYNFLNDFLDHYNFSTY